MPLVRIDVREGRSPDELRAIGAAVHRALVEALGVPPDDLFQVVTTHPPEGLDYSPTYLGVTRTDGIVIVQITLNAGRTVEQKQALYARLAALLGDAAGVAPGDVMVSLVEVPRDNWSFGDGVGQYIGS